MSKDLVPVENVRLIDQFGRYIESRTPTDRQTRPLRRLSPTYVDASILDVELVHNLLSNADVGDARQLLALYDQIIFSDSHIQGELAKRKLAVLGDPWQVVPVDKKNADDVQAAAIAQAQLEAMPSFFDGLVHILDSCIWPVTLVEKIYRPSSKAGLKFEMDELVPVPHFLLYLDPNGPLRVFDVTQDGTVCGTHHMVDPIRYTVHRGHLLGDRDHRGGPLRSLVFWWLFSAFDRDWWVRFLDRYGTPFPVGKYDQSDDDARAILMSAFSLASRLGGLVISDQTSVELHEVQTKSAGEAFELFFSMCQKEKSKLIVGQTTSASAEAAGGLGSGVATAQSEVRDDIRRFDQLRLSNTIKQQIVDPFLQINGLPGRVLFQIGAEAVEDTGKTAEALQQLFQAGVGLTDEGIKAFGERMGLPLQRVATPAPGGPESSLPAPSGLATLAARPANNPRALLADRANARVASEGAADLAAALRGDLAPLRDLLTLSTSAADFERRVLEAFPGWTGSRTVNILEAALTACAFNGTQS